MIKKYVINVCFFFISLFSISQTNKSLKLSGLWNDRTNSTDFIVYQETGYYMIFIKENGTISGIEDANDKETYGFYSDCTLPSIDSLKHEKSKKYPYYFEVTVDDFKSPKRKSLIDCGELNIFKEGKDTIMQIYYSSRQQFVIYKKVKTIPAKIEQYLKSKGIELPVTNKNDKRTIYIPKSRIYTMPNVASKMFLVQGDEVSVLEEKSGWLHIVYVTAKNKEIKGWIKKEDLGTD